MMTTTDLFLMCLENDIEFSIQPYAERKMIVFSIKCAREGVAYREDKIVTEELLRKQITTDIGAHILLATLNLIMNEINNPINLNTKE